MVGELWVAGIPWGCWMTATGSGRENLLEEMIAFVPLPLQRLVSEDDRSAFGREGIGVAVAGCCEEYWVRGLEVKREKPVGGA